MENYALKDFTLLRPKAVRRIVDLERRSASEGSAQEAGRGACAAAAGVERSIHSSPLSLAGYDLVERSGPASSGAQPYAPAILEFVLGAPGNRALPLATSAHLQMLHKRLHLLQPTDTDLLGPQLYPSPVPSVARNPETDLISSEGLPYEESLETTTSNLTRMLANEEVDAVSGIPASDQNTAYVSNIPYERTTLANVQPGDICFHHVRSDYTPVQYLISSAQYFKRTFIDTRPQKGSFNVLHVTIVTDVDREKQTLWMAEASLAAKKVRIKEVPFSDLENNSPPFAPRSMRYLFHRFKAPALSKEMAEIASRWAQGENLAYSRWSAARSFVRLQGRSFWNAARAAHLVSQGQAANLIDPYGKPYTMFCSQFVASVMTAAHKDETGEAAKLLAREEMKLNIHGVMPIYLHTYLLNSERVERVGFLVKLRE